MTQTKFREFIQDAQRRRIFEQESLSFEATELICTLMKAQKMPKSELAKRLGKSKAFVTQLLSGARNMTLHTFADVVFALGHKVELNVAPISATTASSDVIVFTQHMPLGSIFWTKSSSRWKTEIGGPSEGPHSFIPDAACGETAHAA